MATRTTRITINPNNGTPPTIEEYEENISEEEEEEEVLPAYVPPVNRRRVVPVPPVKKTYVKPNGNFEPSAPAFTQISRAETFGEPRLSKSVPPPPMNPLLTFIPDQMTITKEELVSINIPVYNLIVFYLEILQKNGVGILVSSIIQAEALIRTINGTLIQEECPRFAHYFQLMEQQKLMLLTYWGENTGIPPLSQENPLVGKIKYYIVQQSRKFLAIVVFVE